MNKKKFLSCIRSIILGVRWIVPSLANLQRVRNINDNALIVSDTRKRQWLNGQTNIEIF